MDEGAPIFLNTDSGLSLKYRGRFFYSSRTPRASVEKRVAALTLEDDCLYLLPSPALGYGLASLKSKLPKKSHILCIEVDSLVWGIYQRNRPFENEDDEISWIKILDENQLAHKLRNLIRWPFRRVKRIDLSGGSSLFKDDYHKYQLFIEQEVQSYWKNKMTLVYMGGLWMKNLFKNLSLLNKSRSFISLSTKKPVIVIGAGPSLDHSMDDVKKLCHDNFLLAVDTALPVLLAQGVKPHAVLVLEAQAANLQDFIPKGIPSIPMIADLTSYHPLLRKHQGDLFFFISQFAPWNIFHRLKSRNLLPPVIPALGSVGVAALYIAQILTNKAVYFTGLDFAYSFGRSHAKATPHDLLFHQSSSRLKNYSSLLFRGIQSRPLLTCKNRNLETIQSDLILTHYAERARELIAKRSGFFSLDPCGLDLGAVVVGPDHVKTQQNAEYNAVMHKDFFVNSNVCFSDPVTFLRAELDLVNKALEVASSVAKSQCSSLTLEQEKMMKELEYSYMAFPDKPDFDPQNRGFFLRLAISLRHYSDVLKQII